MAAALLAGLAIAAQPDVVDLVAPSADCGQEGFRTAHSAHVRETIEGDPITYRIRVSGRDDYELTIDGSKDRFGSGEVTQYRCTGMRSGGGDVSVLRLFNCGAGVAGLDL